ncbi:MAG: hypothetical protein WA434_07350 [Candidatus Acidiferrales bacterium]
MRAFVASMIALGLFAMPVMAAGGAANNGADPATPKAADSAAKPAPAAANTATAAAPASPAKPAAAAEMETELQQLRDAIAMQAQQIQDQQEKMQQLEDQLKASSTARENLSASPAGAPMAAPASAGAATASLSTSAMSPAPAGKADDKDKLGPIAMQDFKIGVTFFGGWSYYNSTGFAPQFMDTPTEQVGTGNDGFNTFEVNRAYVNFQYTPNEHVTLRVTPDIYRQADGSYSFRLKYGYVDFQKIFGGGAFKNDKLTFGQTQQPLTDWEEGLSGYRYTYLTPWNYVSLSSTYVGAKLHGPIEFNGKEYVDYDFGVFNTASFHAVETDENKQFMVRGTVYPFGTTSDRTGLGFTVFNDYGYKTALPSATQTSLDRLAAIAFYQTHNKADQIAFEYEWGHNAFSQGNLFGGDAPGSSSPYYAFYSAAGGVLTGSTHQQGFAAFGHARLGSSKFSLFGLWQYFQPNTDFDYKGAGLTADPIDWERTVGGITYSVTKQFDVSFGDENFHWVHPQVATTGLPTGGDTNGIVIWTQFNY